MKDEAYERWKRSFNRAANRAGFKRDRRKQLTPALKARMRRMYNKGLTPTQAWNKW